MNGDGHDPSIGGERRAVGTRVRREVLGDAHVDAADARATAFDAPFQQMITENAWGTLWARDAITRRERSMITLALLAATGSFDEIPMHVRACRRTGASPEDVMEALLHVAVYAGVPKANRAIALAKAVYAEEDAGAGVADASGDGASGR